MYKVPIDLLQQIHKQLKSQIIYGLGDTLMDKKLIKNREKAKKLIKLLEENYEL